MLRMIDRECYDYRDMKQTKAPKTAPSPKQEWKNPKSEAGINSDQSNAIFMSMAIDMSWRLAIVVLVPIIAGFELDKHLHTTPLITIVGFVVAMIGMALVLLRMLKLANNLPVPSSTKEKNL
jgi:F0F1-type ATP synthase assembly protein I